MKMSNEKLTRDQQREAARAKAKAMRESQKKSEVRKKALIISSSVVAVVAIAVAVALNWGSFFADQNKLADGPSTAFTNGGITITKDLVVATKKSDINAAVPTITLYEDLQCPACKAFEIPNMPQIKELVKAGKYNLEVHPISFLDGASVNEYSSRAGSALLCVADTDPNHFLDFNSALYNQQPTENTAGPDNAALAALAKQTGITGQSTLDCITKAKWSTWAKNQTPAYKAKIPGSNLTFQGTPFVMVNGQQYQGELNNAAMFLQWLQTVAPVTTN
jgi:protein-disulfide isomerase